MVDDAGALLGMVQRSALLEQWISPHEVVVEAGTLSASELTCGDLADRRLLVAYAGESCREAAARMGQAGVGRLPVLSDEEPHRLVGVVTLSDLLKARTRVAEEEEHRERFFGAG